MERIVQQIRRLTIDEYIKYLTQQYHFALHIESIMRLAAETYIKNQYTFGEDIPNFLMHHAQDEAGHHIWAYNDLNKLGATPIGPYNLATSELLDKLIIVAQGSFLWGVLGLSEIVENFAPTIEIEDIVPQEAIDINADTFIRRHIKVDVRHAKEINDCIKTFSEGKKMHFPYYRQIFTQLYQTFLENSIQ